MPAGAPREYDQKWYAHQVPGGMISNLRHQLKIIDKEDKMQEVLEETARVRAELGYPIMVTPFAQFVGSQAAINAIVGECHKEVTDQAIQYALGLWRTEGSDKMDGAAKAKILNRPRAREIEKIEHPEPTLDEVDRSENQRRSSEAFDGYQQRTGGCLWSVRREILSASGAQAHGCSLSRHF